MSYIDHLMCFFVSINTDSATDMFDKNYLSLLFENMTKISIISAAVKSFG